VPSPHRAEKIKGQVVFENVSFHYPLKPATPEEGQNSLGLEASSAPSNGHYQLNGRGSGLKSNEVLNGVSFTVEPGQQVALLGATGSGKSTLVNLIPRFYDVTGGQICVDGVDVRDWEPAALRAQVGMVLQQTILFSGTIRQNIAYGQPNAPLEAVIAAARAAQAHDFIMAMPDGYESLVEARGVNLSGGQRQRIAIARALLISPGILVLDDSTSAVDMETEFKIQEALETLMQERTTFIVAQRISSVLKADQIIVLEAGRIAAQGAHSQLLQTSPIYRDIYRSQLGDPHSLGVSS
jgi:ATP-binding cassette subfamily B protein